MLVSHRIDHENKVIITSFAPEEVTLKLFIEAYSNYREELKYLPDFQKYHELVDFRPITSINISASELTEFSKLTTTQDERVNITRLALMVDSTSAFTLAKVYETLRNFHPKSKKQVKVFREMDEALTWLNVEEEVMVNNPT
jgi:hypothetical protein